MHLKDNPSFKDIYSERDTIGEFGNTGHSSGAHLHLSMLHIDAKKSVNPFTVFPEIHDLKTPDIGDLFIRVGDTYFTIKDNDNIRLTRHHPLLIDIHDSITSAEKLGIYKLSVVVNNENIFDIDYSEIVLSKNGLTISGKTFQDIYDEKGYYKISNIRYIEGKNDISIFATDYAGNITSKKISFYVNLDFQ
jgi:hypothetical protein